MNPSALQSLYECRHESQEKWTRWTVAMSKAWPEMYRGLSAATDAKPTLWLRMLGDSPDWGEDCVGQDADDIDTYNYNTDLDADEKCWALPLYRWPSPPPAIEVSPKLGEAMEVVRRLNTFWTKHISADGPDSEGAARYMEETLDLWRAARALLAAPIAPAVEQEK